MADVQDMDTGAGPSDLSREQKALYDRQIGALGMATMQKLVKQRVLIVGLRGLGVEIAKNVILAGPAAVTVADAGVVDVADLSAQFYLTEEDKGKDRATVCYPHFRELNPYVEITAHTGAITGDFLRSFTAVVMTCSTPVEKARVNAFCRSQSPPIAFIAAEVHGLFGYVFDDFSAPAAEGGPEGFEGHVVVDEDGEKPRSGWVAAVSQANPCVVTWLEDFPFCFEENDYITFSEVEGMTQLNGMAPARIVSRTKDTVTLELDSTEFSPYVGGGIATQVKMPKVVSHKSLAERIVDPGNLMISDFAKFGRAEQLHVAFQGLHAFQTANKGALPSLNNEAHADAVVAAAKEWNASREGGPLVDEVDETLPRLLALHARAELSPMASVLGGVVAQEVVKVTGKYTPFNQYMYFDALEALPDLEKACAPEAAGDEYTPVGSRYDAQIAVFGRSFQDRLSNLKYFLVGAGALGCEALKSFAMMGVGTGPDGVVHITDDDHIAPSNLNRQFLFRSHHLNMSKSKTAASVIKSMNPDININALELRVMPKTEDYFNDAFWMALDGVANALDNVKARLYVDSKCISYGKPLLESGTLGTKANVQVVIPHKTESYGASPDPPEKETPSCTLHNFPYLIEHVIQLAREEFETTFSKTPADAVAYVKDADAHLNSMRHVHEKRLVVEGVADLVAAKADKADFGACVAWARNEFERLYNHRIRTILLRLPADKVDESGAPFWSGTKRIPSPIEFDAEDPLHMSFILSAANLRAAMLSAPGATTDPEAIKALLADVEVIPFVDDANVVIQTKEDEKVEKKSDDDEDVIVAKRAEIDARLAEGSVSADAFTPHVFEKDDDTNFHIDFIAAASNLRARNYTITEVGRMRVKLISGNIIPALATTTASVVGLVMLELYKLCSEEETPLEKFKNGFMNLALPLFAFSEPVQPKKNTTPGPRGEVYVPDGFTEWDKFEIQGDLTVNEVKEWFATNHNINATMISRGSALVYAEFMPAHSSRLDRKVTDLVRDATGEEFDDSVRRLELVVSCEDDDDNECDVPVTYLVFRP